MCCRPILPSVCFGLSFLGTCVSVRRRDRCTRTPLIRFAGSFSLVLLHAPLPSMSSVRFLPYFGQAHFAPHLLCLCCPPSLWLSCVSLFVLPCGARGIVLSLCSCCFALSPFWFFALLAVLVRALLFPLLSALLCCGSCLCPVCLPSPASGLVCALVQLAPWCAGTSLWVSGCSCDGSVALLSCWECG